MLREPRVLQARGDRRARDPQPHARALLGRPLPGQGAPRRRAEVLREGRRRRRAAARDLRRRRLRLDRGPLVGPAAAPGGAARPRLPPGRRPLGRSALPRRRRRRLGQRPRRDVHVQLQAPRVVRRAVPVDPRLPGGPRRGVERADLRRLEPRRRFSRGRRAEQGGLVRAVGGRDGGGDAEDDGGPAARAGPRRRLRRADGARDVRRRADGREARGRRRAAAPGLRDGRGPDARPVRGHLRRGRPGRRAAARHFLGRRRGRRRVVAAAAPRGRRARVEAAGADGRAVAAGSEASGEARAPAPDLRGERRRIVGLRRRDGDGAALLHVAGGGRGAAPGRVAIGASYGKSFVQRKGPLRAVGAPARRLRGRDVLRPLRALRDRRGAGIGAAPEIAGRRPGRLRAARTGEAARRGRREAGPGRRRAGGAGRGAGGDRATARRRAGPGARRRGGPGGRDGVPRLLPGRALRGERGLRRQVLVALARRARRGVRGPRQGRVPERARGPQRARGAVAAPVRRDDRVPGPRRRHVSGILDAPRGVPAGHPALAVGDGRVAGRAPAAGPRRRREGRGGGRGRRREARGPERPAREPPAPLRLPVPAGDLRHRPHPAAVRAAQGAGELRGAAPDRGRHRSGAHARRRGGAARREPQGDAGPAREGRAARAAPGAPRAAPEGGGLHGEPRRCGRGDLDDSC
mmetsp:Transcript_27694/g.94282  ORF Transcript_27694/g.94282 Transcript_27694/m.94282 type:complete len:691 (+) Transcript_27694:602-2674(+)